jgi:hypothetical protein
MTLRTGYDSLQSTGISAACLPTHQASTAIPMSASTRDVHRGKHGDARRSSGLKKGGKKSKGKGGGTGSGGWRQGAGRQPLVPKSGKGWEERRTRLQEVEQELQRDCRKMYAPGARGDGPVARTHFRVWDGPKRTPKQGHIGPRIKNSARHQPQSVDKEATQDRVDEYEDTRKTLCPLLAKELVNEEWEESARRRRRGK